MAIYTEVRSYRFEREKEIMGGIDNAILKIKALVQRQAVSNLQQGHPYAKWDTGRLASNIAEFSHIEKDESTITAVVGSNLQYAIPLELGHIQHPGQFVPAIGKRLVASSVPPYPFLFPAVEQSRNEIVDILKGSVKKGK